MNHYPTCQLWPELLPTQAKIEFWLNSPEVPAAKAEATRAELARMLPFRQQKCWLNLMMYLNQARSRAPKAPTADVVAFCQELYATGQVDREELSTIKHRLLVGTHREFEWHQARLRAVCAARSAAHRSEAAADQAA